MYVKIHVSKNKVAIWFEFLKLLLSIYNFTICMYSMCICALYVKSFIISTGYLISVSLYVESNSRWQNKSYDTVACNEIGVASVIVHTPLRTGLDWWNQGNSNGELWLCQFFHLPNQFGKVSRAQMVRGKGGWGDWWWYSKSDEGSPCQDVAGCSLC